MHIKGKENPMLKEDISADTRGDTCSHAVGVTASCETPIVTWALGSQLWSSARTASTLNN